jgi:anti-sigma factor RsiW
MGSIRQLISDYLDGELTDQESGELAAALAVDPAELDHFVLHHFIHCQLLDWMDHHRLQDDPMSGAVDDADARLAPASFPAPRGPAPRSRSRLPWIAVAAALLIVAGISAVTYVVASRPTIVAQVTEATNCQWHGAPSAFPVGTLLQDGQQLELVRGSAVVTFASGAKLLLEGPASVRLDSDKQIHMTGGRIAAKVPRQAIGFTVTTSLARFVDLGTAFTLHLNAEKSFELHVFEGLVEVQLDQRFGKAARQPARIAEVLAITFDVRSGDIAPLHFQEGKQMPF